MPWVLEARRMALDHSLTRSLTRFSLIYSLSRIKHFTFTYHHFLALKTSLPFMHMFGIF